MLDINVFSGLTVTYHDAGEREIRAITLYVVGGKLCTDAAGENEVDHDLALEICEKGFLRVFDTDTFYAPTSFKDADGTLTVGYNATTVAVPSAAAASLEPEA